MKHGFFAALGAAALLLALAACGGTAAGAPSASPSEAEGLPAPSTAAFAPAPSERENVTTAPAETAIVPHFSPSESELAVPKPEDGAEEVQETIAASLCEEQYFRMDQTTSIVFGGMEEAGSMAVRDIRVGLNDLSVALIPRGTGADISAFVNAEQRFPVTTVNFQPEMIAATIRIKNTVLDTGDPVEAPGNDDWVFDFLEEHSLTYPSVFPRGAVGEDNRFFSNAAVSTDGTDTTITLIISEKAQMFRIEKGSLDSQGYLPYFRIVFAEDAPSEE